MTPAQRKELLEVFNGIKGAGILDYVSAWYGKAAQYMQHTKIVCALVSTNSITQGEQVSVLWGTLLQEYSIKIHFAHRTFKWTIDEKKAKGMRVAAVFVVIIGFAAHDTDNKYIYDYETLTSDPHKVKAININPYLVDGDDLTITKNTKPICDVPEMKKGSQPTDGGNLILSSEEKEELVLKEPLSNKFLKKYIGGEEFINNKTRWCLWLKEASPNELRQMPNVLQRLDAVKKSRQESKKDATREWAQKPSFFTEDRQPNTNYLAVPEVSSERRIYIPIGFLTPDVICSNKIQIIPDTTLFHFGVLTSIMHMEWMRHVTGRLKGDYQYSSSIVYNNFPWPDASESDKEDIAEKAKGVLDAREQFPDSTLADLYDPNTMPPALLKAHQTLDKAVDKAYRKASFKNEKERIEFLFERYQKLTQPLIQPEKKKQRKGQLV